jgi:hypothetical protein
MRSPLIVLLLSSAACSGPPLPDGVTCDGALTAVADRLALALAVAASSGAVPGDCVLVAGGTYTGPLEVSAPGIIVTAEADAEVVLTSPAIGIELTASATVRGFVIDTPGRHGVLITGSGARLLDTEVIDPGEAAVMIKCEDSGCMQRSGRIDVEGLRASNAKYGIYVDAADVIIRDSVVSGGGSEQLGGGGGLYAVNGATVELEDTRLVQNAYGIIADGATTRVLAIDVEVSGNTERGVWAQGLRGSRALPALELRGAGTRIVDNRVVGVGAFDTAGVVISGAELRGTIETEVLLDLMRRAMLGEGLSLLAGSREVEVTQTRMVDNGRAQVLVDTAGNDIRLDASNTVSGGRYPVVVQASVEVVDVPAAQLAAGVSGLAVPLSGIRFTPASR